MPRVEHEPHVARAEVGDQLARLRHRVHERKFAAHQRELRAHILQPEAQAMVVQHARHLRQPRHVLPVVRPIRQLRMTRRQPRADARHARRLQSGRDLRQLPHPVAKRRVILAKIHRQPRRRPRQPLRRHVRRDRRRLRPRHRREFLRPRLDRLKPVALRERIELELARHRDPDAPGGEGDPHASPRRRRGLYHARHDRPRRQCRGGLHKITTVHGRTVAADPAQGNPPARQTPRAAHPANQQKKGTGGPMPSGADQNGCPLTSSCSRQPWPSSPAAT